MCIYIGTTLCFTKEIIWKSTEYIVDVIPVFVDIEFIEVDLWIPKCDGDDNLHDEAWDCFLLRLCKLDFIGGGRFLSHPGCVQSLRRHNLHLEVQLGVLPQIIIGGSLEEHNFFCSRGCSHIKQEFYLFQETPPLGYFQHHDSHLAFTQVYKGILSHGMHLALMNFMWCNAPKNILLIFHVTFDSSKVFFKDKRWNFSMHPILQLL